MEYADAAVQNTQPAARGARALDRGQTLPLWAQLLDDLVRRLEANAFTQRFPSEHELVAEYQVSRHTVREALRRLRETGVVQSNRGRLSVVRQAMIEQPLGALYSLFREVEARGIGQRSVVRVRDVRTSAAAADVLMLPRGTRLVYIERLRYADDEPLAWDRTWLPLSVAEGLLHVDLTHTALYDELYLSGTTLTGGQEQIEAVILTGAQRKLLEAPPGTAALAITRIGCSRSQPVEWRQTLVRGDRFRVTAQWSNEQAYRLNVGSALSSGAAKKGPRVASSPAEGPTGARYS